MNIPFSSILSTAATGALTNEQALHIAAGLQSGIIIFMAAMFITLFFVLAFEKRLPFRLARFRGQANQRYGTSLTEKDALVLHKCYEGGFGIIGMTPIRGPRGNWTIDVTVDGKLIRNVTRSKNKLVLKESGEELPLISATV